jgi:hypothetical protein
MVTRQASPLASVSTSVFPSIFAVGLALDLLSIAVPLPAANSAAMASESSRPGPTWYGRICERRLSGFTSLSTERRNFVERFIGGPEDGKGPRTAEVSAGPAALTAAQPRCGIHRACCRNASPAAVSRCQAVVGAASSAGSFSVGCPPETWSGVQTGPGATTFTRIPLPATCCAGALLNA